MASLSALFRTSMRSGGHKIRNCNSLRRRYTTDSAEIVPGLIFWPSYFSLDEQKTLLAASLYKLDSLESRQARRKRQDFQRSQLSKGLSDANKDIATLFAPDALYEFQEVCTIFYTRCAPVIVLKGHFDGVIHHYREMHLSAWPLDKYPDLEHTLKRLKSAFPDPFCKVQTHLLHLASHGEILPHIDNLDASGSWILGVSLGDERVLHLKGKEDNREVTLKLPSGSVYVQRLVPNQCG